MSTSLLLIGASTAQLHHQPMMLTLQPWVACEGGDNVLKTCHSKGSEVQFRTVSGRFKKIVRKLHAHFVQ